MSPTSLLSLHNSTCLLPLWYTPLSSRFGAFLPGIELFDSSAFAINESEAALMDPQQRLLLMAAAEAMTVPSHLVPGVAVGVFVGASALDYSRLAARCVHPYCVN